MFSRAHSAHHTARRPTREKLSVSVDRSSSYDTMLFRLSGMSAVTRDYRVPINKYI